MHSIQLTTGRTFGIRFDPGESLFPALAEFCDSHRIRQGYIPMLLAAFAAADIVGTCDKLDNPAAPVWSKVQTAAVAPADLPVQASLTADAAARDHLVPIRRIWTTVLASRVAALPMRRPGAHYQQVSRCVTASAGRRPGSGTRKKPKV